MDIWLNLLTLWNKFAYDTKKIRQQIQEIHLFFYSRILFIDRSISQKTSNWSNGI